MSRKAKTYDGDPFGKCKRWGHAWDELGGPPVGVQTYIQGDEEWLRCIRCGTVRVFVVSLTTGKVTYTRYIYADGYRWSGRQGEAPTRAELRREWAQSRRPNNVTKLKRASA